MTTCRHCNDPLTVEVDLAEEDDEAMTGSQTVPDDIGLSCGDHFHWQCLLDSLFELSKCPACGSDISSQGAPSSSSAPSSNPQILASVHNEGGLQDETDLFPVLQEECYLKAYPEERKCRAFLEFCREGDHRAIVDLLQSTQDVDDDDDEEEQQAVSSDAAARDSNDVDRILRYQDSLAGEQSGLHAAVANGHREVVWLLLLLASSYPELEFPALVFQEAASLGIMREDQKDKADIRGLRDANGRTAEDVAREGGDVVWTGWFGNGRLALP